MFIKVLLVSAVTMFSYSFSFAKGGVLGCGPKDLAGKVSEMELNMIDSLHQTIGGLGSNPVCLEYGIGDAGKWLEIHSASTVLGGSITFYYGQKIADLSLRFTEKGKAAFCRIRLEKTSDKTEISSLGGNLCETFVEEMKVEENKRYQKIKSVLTHLVFASEAYGKFLNRESFLRNGDYVGKIPRKYWEQESGSSVTLEKMTKNFKLAQSQMHFDADMVLQ